MESLFAAASNGTFTTKSGHCGLLPTAGTVSDGSLGDLIHDAEFIERAIPQQLAGYQNVILPTGCPRRMLYRVAGTGDQRRPPVPALLQRHGKQRGLAFGLGE